MMNEFKNLSTKLAQLSVVLAVLAIFPLAVNVYSAWASVPLEFGYLDFSYPPGTGGNSEPTGEKPESKLWWNDGFWWGILWSTPGNAYHIFRLNLATQDWNDTGVVVDDRNDSRADALWDGQRLYIVSHIFAKNAGAPAPSGQRGELYRYSYNASTKSYSLDPGFPIEITLGKSETLVVAKDSTGNLWVTYVEDKKVMVNHSLGGDDLTWGTPYALPITEAAGLSSDDISSIVAYNQHVGIMWSNQEAKKTFFAVHPVGSTDDVWTRAIPYAASSDDHINLKSLETDDAGNVFAVIKTSKSAELVVLLVCENNLNRCKTGSDWTSYPIYTSGEFNPTRPILLIDTSNRDLYVFTRNADANGVSGIYYKSMDMDDIQVPPGIGVPFIKDSQYDSVNDPTSTKQNVNATTGLVVLASDSGPDVYLHNYKDLGGGIFPIVTSFTPAQGTVDAAITITGANFTGTTGVNFNGVSALNFNVDSDTQITASVPSGATTGPISVTNAAGTGTSMDDFVVIVPPLIDSFSPTEGPAGTEVTLVGSGFTGATDVTFNSVSASSFALDSDAQIRAVVPFGGTPGPIAVINPAGTGSSSSTFSVIESPAVTDRSPVPDATNVQVSTVVTATFSKPMDASTINSGNFTLNDGSGPINGAVGYDSDTRTATFTPTNLLQPHTTYTITLSGEIMDESGIAIYDAPEMWSFTTVQAIVQFSAANFAVDEHSGSATIEVTLSNPAAEMVSVEYLTSDGTAIAGEDYMEISGILSFQPGELVKEFGISIIDDGLNEENETLGLQLLPDSTNASLGTPSTATLTIIDNDPEPMIYFSNAEYSVNEFVGEAMITVALSNPSGRMVSVAYATSDGTAEEGKDYLAVNDTLTFAPGETSKSFNVLIISDAIDEPDEWLELTLSAPDGVILSTPNKAKLNIIDGLIHFFLPMIIR